MLFSIFIVIVLYIQLTLNNPAKTYKFIKQVNIFTVLTLFQSRSQLICSGQAKKSDWISTY